MYDLILKNISRFITLTPEEEQYFTSLLKIKKLKKKQYLLQEGEINRYDYFVNKGCLRTYTIDEKGLEHIVQFSIEDWWVGDMYSFLSFSKEVKYCSSSGVSVMKREIFLRMRSYIYQI